MDDGLDEEVDEQKLRNDLEVCAPLNCIHVCPP